MTSITKKRRIRSEKKQRDEHIYSCGICSGIVKEWNGKPIGCNWKPKRRMNAK